MCDMTTSKNKIKLKCMFQDVFLSLVLSNKRKERWSYKASIHQSIVYTIYNTTDKYLYKMFVTFIITN